MMAENNVQGIAGSFLGKSLSTLRKFLYTAQISRDGNGAPTSVQRTYLGKLFGTTESYGKDEDGQRKLTQKVSYSPWASTKYSYRNDGRTVVDYRPRFGDPVTTEIGSDGQKTVLMRRRGTGIERAPTFETSPEASRRSSIDDDHDDDKPSVRQVEYPPQPSLFEQGNRVGPATTFDEILGNNNRDQAPVIAKQAAPPPQIAQSSKVVERIPIPNPKLKPGMALAPQPLRRPSTLSVVTNAGDLPTPAPMGSRATARALVAKTPPLRDDRANERNRGQSR